MNSRRRFAPRPPDFGLNRTDPKVEAFAASNLRNPKFFPAYKHCAPYKAYSANRGSIPLIHWCFLGEIVENESVGRVILRVKDKDGQHILVAFYFDNDASFDGKGVKTGHTIAVLYGEKHNFLDGSYGLRLEHPKFVKVSGHC